MPPDHDLSDFRVFGSVHIDSYLGQVILLERRSIPYVIEGYAGSRYVAVKYVDCRGRQKLFVSVHFPHSDNTDESYTSAIFSLSQMLRECPGICAIVAGDWNAQPGDARYAELSQMFSERGYQAQIPTVETWHGRFTNKTYDYVFLSPRLWDYLPTFPIQCLQVFTLMLPMSFALITIWPKRLDARHPTP